MAAMSWATYAILLMARHDVPTWPATVAAGLLTGLAMATRTGGIITHAYLIGAMTLCALDVTIRRPGAAAQPLAQIALRTLAAMALAWITMIALWPWLQVGNPLRQFAIAYGHFTHNPMVFGSPSWGEVVMTQRPALALHSRAIFSPAARRVPATARDRAGGRLSHGCALCVCDAAPFPTTRQRGP